MAPYQMEILTETMKRHQRLESMPLCCFEVTKGGNRELCIIDGHHRVRAALAAGLVTGYVLVIEEELTREQIVSRQLAHNALTGYDEDAVLADLLAEITDTQLRRETGLELADLKERPALDALQAAELIPAEAVVLLFAPGERQKWDRAIKLLELLKAAEKTQEVQVADFKDFDSFAKGIRQVCRAEKITNVTKALAALSELILAGKVA
jgi:ParB-like chromosome segregation protein Spo0J